MPDIVCPVFSDENGDLNIFSSPAEMSAHVEVIDVENDEYTFFDTTGQRLLPRIEGEAVQFSVDRDARPTPEILEAKLRRPFAALPERWHRFAARAEAAQGLSELVALHMELQAEFKGRHRAFGRGSPQ